MGKTILITRYFLYLTIFKKNDKIFDIEKKNCLLKNCLKTYLSFLLPFKNISTQHFEIDLK